MGNVPSSKEDEDVNERLQKLLGLTKGRDDSDEEENFGNFLSKANDILYDDDDDELDKIMRLRKLRDKLKSVEIADSSSEDDDEEEAFYEQQLSELGN